MTNSYRSRAGKIVRPLGIISTGMLDPTLQRRRKMLIIDRHDMDGDGVIKIDEMRIGGSLDQL
jgi:hypothetical protein